ncbi:protein SpAN-like [Oculina patagonica]
MKWFGVLLLVTAVLGASENPDENLGIHDPNLFEGDMILSKEQIKKAEAGEDIDSSRKRGSSRFRLWPNGVVPYKIHLSLAGNSSAVAAIRAGMEEWTTKTCIRFKRRTSEQAYINFVFGAGCSSFVGRTGRPQNINLAQGCWFRGIVAHEIGHAIGFYHEQSRPDRDTYITVLTQNIRDGRENNFRKYNRSTIDSLGTKYDYKSLMHYGKNFFSKNNSLPTIQVKIPPGSPGESIGQRRGLSSIDAQQADLLYKEQCGQRPGDECSNYQILSSADRSKGNTAQNNVRCDRRDLSPGWYRFTGAAGDQMPDQCVAVRRCGTHAPGWLRGAHPTVQQGVVTRQVCYHWRSNCCLWSNNIKVKNCGGFFVYELQDTPVCSLRYCGNAGARPTTLAPTTTQLPPTTGKPYACPPGKKTDDPQGRCCVFPFVYEGVSYDSCTSINHNKLWCSFDAVYAGQWANCASCQDRDRRCRRWPSFFCRFSRYVRANCRKKCHGC